jgi:hypothetical protein
MPNWNVNVIQRMYQYKLSIGTLSDMINSYSIMIPSMTALKLCQSSKNMGIRLNSIWDNIKLK